MLGIYILRLLRCRMDLYTEWQDELSFGPQMGIFWQYDRETTGICIFIQIFLYQNKQRLSPALSLCAIPVCVLGILQAQCPHFLRYPWGFITAIYSEHLQTSPKDLVTGPTSLSSGLAGIESMSSEDSSCSVLHSCTMVPPVAWAQGCPRVPQLLYMFKFGLTFPGNWVDMLVHQSPDTFLVWAQW